MYSDDADTGYILFMQVVFIDAVTAAKMYEPITGRLILINTFADILTCFNRDVRFFFSFSFTWDRLRTSKQIKSPPAITVLTKAWINNLCRQQKEPEEEHRGDAEEHDDSHFQVAVHLVRDSCRNESCDAGADYGGHCDPHSLILQFNGNTFVTNVICCQYDTCETFEMSCLGYDFFFQ